MRAADLRSPFHGVRVAGAVHDARSLALAFRPRIRGDWAIGAESAAAIEGLPLPYRCAAAQQVQIAVPRGSNRPVGRNVRARIVRPDLFSTVLVDGMPLTAPALTWCMIAPRATKEELVRLGDALVSVNRSYVGRRAGFVPLSLEDLALAVKCWARCDGVANLRAALPWIRTGAASPPESDLRMQLIAAGLPEPEINVDVHDDRGNWLARVDALFRQERLVFEYEGDGHRTDRRQFRRDIRRGGGLEDAGYRVMRVTGDDIYRHVGDFRRRARQVFERRRRSC